ncbi:MAG: hypothetical protein ACTSSE_08025 [Candidatus Thorarchaeota archaeon]
MASVSTAMEPITLASVVSNVMTRLIENLPDDQKENLTHWIEDIETTAEEKVRKLDPKQIKKRKPEAVAAAAIYDTFIQFESRTRVKIGLIQMQTALGQTACSINTAWKRLFDNRVYLRGEFLDVIYTENDWTVSDAVSNVMQVLRRAVETPTPEATTWLAEIEKESIELSKTIPSGVTDSYDSLLVAITVIYTTIQLYHGKRMIPIGQKDLSLLAATSPAMISKCWIEFFGERNKS